MTALFDNPVRGQKFRPVAEDFRGYNEAARYVRERTRGPFARGQVTRNTDTNILWGVNSTDTDLIVGSVVALDAPLILPSVNVDHFKFLREFRIAKPTANNQRFGVCLAPIKRGKAGPVAFDGIFPMQANFSTDSAQYVTSVAGSTVAASNAAGRGEVWWKEAGTGLLWAWVKLNSPAVHGIIGEITTEISAATETPAPGKPGWGYVKLLGRDTTNSDHWIEYDSGVKIWNDCTVIGEVGTIIQGKIERYNLDLFWDAECCDNGES